MAAVALVVTGVQYAERWTSARPQSSDATVVASAPELTSADVVARHAVAAFGDSAVGTDTSVTPVQRAVGMPNDPVAGLTRDTAAGPVQIVLPGGLGPAQATVDGHVVYPNRGAGFDFLAENTGSGTRTIARIPDPSGPRAVTTFVRTPADTVMLAHTNGYLTINRATPTAETVALFSPAETRDATGALVPSSYVVRQLRPGLYQMTEVIDPTPETVFPVFVDPPLHVGGLTEAPLPAGFLDTLSGAVDAVGGAITTAANATVSGVTAVGTFVKENPLESAILVGGVALAITGVGGPAGAAAIAAATVNLSSAGLDIAAAAMPDNELLANASTIIGVVSMATPQGATKKVVKEGLEELTEQAARNTDTIIDVAKAAPTPPGKLVDDITGATPGKADVPGAATPKAPNAPPTTGSGIPDGNVIPGGEHSWPLPPAAADRRLSTKITSDVTVRPENKNAIAPPKKNADGIEVDPNTQAPLGPKRDMGHKPGEEKRTSKEMAKKYGLSRREFVEWENNPARRQWENASSNRGHEYEDPRPADVMYNSYKRWLRNNMEKNPQLAADPTAQRRLRDEIDNPTPNIRPSSERANINAEMRDTGTTRTVPLGSGQQDDSESSESSSGTSSSQQRDDRGGNKDRKDSSNNGSKKKDDRKKSEPKKKKKKTQAQKKRKRQNR
ncbi:GH-E family nuclease [Mycobacterium sp. MS1601]|uniref:GH-E family nuclease n=1 Tax=Mycobacterium sp. MS1601 TaxID=1936029 RepID=UPI0018D3C897|nr:GH-E family nuclease [Mycobacterium sp. MS1601]